MPRTAQPQATLSTPRHPTRTQAAWATGLSLVVVAAASLLWTGNARAQGAEIYIDADLALGEKMIAEHKCVACHISKVGGDGSAMYKTLGRINNAGLLRGMVEMCNTQMNLGLFPEEVSAAAAVLNRDHYKFK